MPAADRSSSQQQILQAVLDVTKQALKVDLPGPINVTFTGGTVDCDIDAATGDNIAINDAVTGNSVEVIGRKLQVGGAVTATGTFTQPPSTDFQVQTLNATTTPQAITWSLTPVTSIAIITNGDNAGKIKFGKADVLTNYFPVAPGGALNIPISDGVTVYYVRDAGAGLYEFSVLAVN